MRKTRYFLIISLLLIALFIGCANEEKKPEMKPETIVVPEVSSIPFDLIKLEDAPAVVRKVAKTLEDEEFFNWTTDNGNCYILIKPHIEIEQIEQRVPGENYAWLNVKLKSVEKNTKGGDDQNEPVIAKFDLKNKPNAVGFQFKRDETPTAQPQSQPTPRQEEQKAVEETQANNQPTQPKDDQEENGDYAKGPAIRITNPMPGDAVSSPVAVSGQVGFVNGDARVRVVDSSGQVMAEKPVKIEAGKFETTLSFPAPSGQERGMVEAFLINPQDNSEVSRVSIYVTLLPSP